MALCTICGLAITDETGCCPHHLFDKEKEWPLYNKAMCDQIHRGIVPVRLPPGERGEINANEGVC